MASCGNCGMPVDAMYEHYVDGGYLMDGEWRCPIHKLRRHVCGGIVAADNICIRCHHKIGEGKEDMARKDKKPEFKAHVIAEWDYFDERYRLVVKAYTYERVENLPKEEYFLEELQQNALGEPQWAPTAWKKFELKRDDINSCLVSALKSLTKGPL